MNEIGKFLVLIGISIAIVGVLLWTGLGRQWLGKLPGDVSYTKGNFSLYFPVVTCVVLSVVLTLIMWLFRR